MSKRATVTALVGATIFLVGALVTPGRAQEQARRPPQAGPGLPDLGAGLMATPGCLGVETARTRGGKSVIFAWFEDKKVVLRWFHSETHQQLMGLFPEVDYHKPLGSLADDIGPIMVVASMTMSDEAHFEATNLPISQIAIELYKPVPGGLYLGGRFAPDSSRPTRA